MRERVHKYPIIGMFSALYIFTKLISLMLNLSNIKYGKKSVF